MIFFYKSLFRFYFFSLSISFFLYFSFDILMNPWLFPVVWFRFTLTYLLYTYTFTSDFHSDRFIYLSFCVVVVMTSSLSSADFPGLCSFTSFTVRTTPHLPACLHLRGVEQFRHSVYFIVKFNTVRHKMDIFSQEVVVSYFSSCHWPCRDRF